MTLHPRRHPLRAQTLAVAWLTVVWVLLWGDLSVANVLAGAVLGFLVTRALPMPTVEFHGRLRPLGLLRLLARFTRELVVASFQVARLAMTPGRRPRSAVIAVQLRSHSDLYLTLTAQVCSLVPGTVVVEAHRVTGTLYLHLLDVDLAGGIEAARRHALGNEELILRALASDDELADAGLLARPGVPA